VALAPFLGRTAAFPIGPYVMAAVLGCPLVAMFATRAGEHYDVHFEPLRDKVVLPRRERAQALGELAGAYAARLEHHARRAPLEWFNFYDFWHLPETDSPDAAQ
jgi:predicted LPLAT superfamily acyltransferase